MERCPAPSCEWFILARLWEHHSCQPFRPPKKLSSLLTRLLPFHHRSTALCVFHQPSAPSTPTICILNGFTMPRSGYDRSGMAPTAPGAQPYHEWQGSETPRAQPTRVGTPSHDVGVDSPEYDDATPRPPRPRQQLSHEVHFEAVRSRLLEILEQNRDTIEHVRQRSHPPRANDVGNLRASQPYVDQTQSGRP